jgi:hemerythrin-like domain-containing protein
MGPTEALVKEHEDIRRMLAVVMEMCRRLESGADVPPEHVEQAIDFIRGFADSYHHAKEEDLLFPAMERSGIPRDDGPIAVMLAEHDEGRAFVRAAAEAVERLRQGDDSARPVIASNLRNYAGLLDGHIEKENQVLYPMADSRLSGDDQSQLERDFEQTNTTGDAPQRYERYQGILQDLSGRYRAGGTGEERKRPGW